MDKGQEYEDFLKKVAAEVDGMLCGTINKNGNSIGVDISSVKSRFDKQVVLFEESYRDYLEGKRDIHDPSKWPEYRNTVFADILLACYYQTLAVIYDWQKGRTPIRGTTWQGFSMPKHPRPDLKLTPGQQTGVIMLGCIKNQLSGYNPDTIEEALRHVKKDLLENCQQIKPTETKQKTTPSKLRGIATCFGKILEKVLYIFTKSFWDSLWERMWPK